MKLIKVFKLCQIPLNLLLVLIATIFLIFLVLKLKLLTNKLQFLLVVMNLI